MWELSLFISVAIATSLLNPFASAEGSQPPFKVPGDSTKVDGFIFDGPARKLPGPKINDNLWSTTISALREAPDLKYNEKLKGLSLVSTFPKCFSDCPSGPEKRPVCGSDGTTYDNPKQVHCSRMCGKYVRIVSEGPCNDLTTTTPIFTIAPSLTFKLCIDSCPKITQYNPVCGTDGVTYANPGELNCAHNCGKDVEIAIYRVCGDKVLGRPSS